MPVSPPVNSKSSGLNETWHSYVLQTWWKISIQAPINNNLVTQIYHVSFPCLASCDGFQRCSECSLASKTLGQWSHVAFSAPNMKLCCTALSDAPSSLSPPFLLLTQLLVRYCSPFSHTSAQGHTPPGIKSQFKVRTSRKTLRNFSSLVFTGLRFQLHPPSCKLLWTGGFASAGLPIS